MATVGASDQTESTMVRNGTEGALDGSREHHGTGEPFLFTSESVGEGHPGKNPLVESLLLNAVLPKEETCTWHIIRL